MAVLNKEGFHGRDFICLKDFTPEEIHYMLTVAKELKTETKAGIPHPILQGKNLAMIFTKSSTRTRVAFETGMLQLGGHALFLSNRDIQIGRGEPIKDTARVLSRMVDGIMIRTHSHQDVVDLAEYSEVPVINGLSDLLHPTQVLADLLTIQEYKNRLKGLKLTFIGDGNNMAHSLMFAGKMGMHVVISTPAGYKPNPDIVALAQADAAKGGGCIEWIEDPAEAAKGADILYTDVWASMGQEEEATVRMKVFKNYRIDSEILNLAQKDAIVMHCLPAHRGEEITDEVMEGSQSVVFDEAENRLHAHKAIMALLL